MYVRAFLYTQNPDSKLRLTLSDFQRAMSSINPAYTSSQVLHISHYLYKYDVTISFSSSTIIMTCRAYAYTNINIPCKLLECVSLNL